MPLDAAPTFQSQNFAPVAPLLDARKTARSGKDNKSSLAALFREIYQEIINQNEEAFREQIEVGRIVGNLISGKLIMKRDPQSAGYVFLKPTGVSAARDRSNYPVFQQNSVVLQSKWCKSKVEVAARHYGDGYKAEIQNNLINTIARSYFKNIFTGEYELNEILQAQMFGTYISRYFYDNRLNQMVHLAPVIKKESKAIVDGYAGCQACGFEGVPEDFRRDGEISPKCPECASYKTTKMLEPQMVDENLIVDVEEIKQGDITGGLLAFPACRFDIRGMAHDSNFFLYEQEVPMRVVRNLYGDIGINESGMSSDNFGLEVINALSARGTNVEGHGESDINRFSSINRSVAKMSEMWLKPEWYAGCRLDHSEETFGGVIPADVPLEEIFPSGVCVTGFNSMRLLTGVFEERSNVVSGVYFLQSFSGLGKGVSDSVDVAKDLNEIHSMAMAGLKRYGASGIFYDKNTLKPSDAQNLFKPDRAVAVDLAKNPHISNINQAVGQIQSRPVNDQLPMYAVQLNNLLSTAFMTGDFAQGAVQDVDINTLGGQQLAHAKSEEQKGAILTMKINHRELSAEKIFALFKKHIKIPRFFSNGSADRHARIKGKWISADDLTTETVKFDAIPGSEQPTNTYEKRIAAQALVEKAGGLPVLSQIAQTDPKMASWYVKQFGVELPILDEDEMRLVCLTRLDNIKELSQVLPDPQAIIENLDKPLFVREDGHLAKADFLANVLDDDETSEWNPAATDAVQLLIERHYELEAEAQLRNESIKQRVMAQLQAKAAQAQQVINQPMQDEQNRQQQQQIEQQQQHGLMEEGLKRVADEAQKDADVERQNQQSDADHNRALQLEAMRQQGQKELANANNQNKNTEKK